MKKNKIKIQEAKRRYRQEHKEEISLYRKEYNEKNKEKISIYRKQYHKEHREELNKKQRIRNKQNPGKSLQYSRTRRALRQAVEEVFPFDLANFVLEFWGKKCAICGNTEGLTFDHWLPLSKGHPLSVKNAVLMCGSCNDSKGSKFPLDAYNKKIVKKVQSLLLRQEKLWSTVNREEEVNGKSALRKEG